MRVFVDWYPMPQFVNGPHMELEFDNMTEAQEFCDDENNGSGYAKIITDPRRVQWLMETQKGAYDAPALRGHAAIEFFGIDDEEDDI